MARPDCPDCQGTGWRLLEQDGGRVAIRCACGASDRFAHALARARIPPRYQHCDFDNFDVDLYDQEPDAAAWNRSLQAARLLVERFVNQSPLADDQGLLLMGPCGVGKTHLAVAALKRLIARGLAGVFYDYRDLLKQIQASYNPESQTSEMAILEPVLRADVLLLDDLGASKPSLWTLETLGHILTVRYNERRITLMTTNFLDQPRTRNEETLADRIGQRIRSRLYEMCRTVEMQAPDFRRRIRRAWPIS